jgi:hypothetical protein
MSAKETLVRNISDTICLRASTARERRKARHVRRSAWSHRWAAPRGKVGGHPIYGWQLLWADEQRGTYQLACRVSTEKR